MNNNKIVFPDSLIKFIRFCKDNNLYLYIKSKYKDIKTLNNAIKLLFIENYVLGIFNFTSPEYVGKFKINDFHIKLCDLKWKEYAKDMIIAENKKKCDLFRSLYNSNVTRHFSSYNNELSYLDDLFFLHG